jgi:hypothetical protein
LLPINFGQGIETMGFEEAMSARIDGAEAVAEIARHGVIADYEDGELFECRSGEVIAKAGRDGCYCGGAVLRWLGY